MVQLPGMSGLARRLDLNINVELKFNGLDKVDDYRPYQNC
jgi:hypothetical protein